MTHAIQKKIRQLFFLLYLLIFISVLPAVAQSKYKPAPNALGKWTYTYLNESKGSYRSDANYVLSPAELSAFKKKINAVVETLHQNPVTVKPVGYEATITAGIFANMFRYKYNVANLAGKIPQAEIVLRFCPLSEEIGTGKLRAGCMEVEHCDVWLNDLDRTVSLAGTHLYEAIDNKKPLDEAFAKMNEVFQAPEVFQKMADGVTLYTNSMMVIAAKDRPYWLHVTAGEYFDLQIRYYSMLSEREVNSMFLDMVLQEKKSFSEEDLKKPAYNGENPASQITIYPNNRPYMRLNPGYFDKKIPRTSLQLITIKINQDILNKGFNADDYLKAEQYTDILRYYEYSKSINVEVLKTLLDIK